MDKKKRCGALRAVCIVMYVWAAVSAVLYVVMRLSPSFAEFFNRTVSAASRRVFVFFTDFFPFSVAELAVLLSPVALIAVTAWAIVRVVRRGAAGARRVIAVLLAFICFLGSTFVFNGAAGYFGVGVGEKIGVDTSDPTEDELYDACSYLADRINEAAASGQIYSDSTGATVMPDSIGETALKIESMYSSFRDVFGFPQSFSSVPKILVTSPVITYTHVSGLFSDTTAEININTNYPDYVVTSTIAHELAHQRGVAPENEANFMAFAVLVDAPDPYLRYAGCLDAFTNVSQYLYKLNRDRYAEVRGRLCKTASDDLHAYSVFFDKYRENRAAEVSDKVNDAYLKSQGTSGTVSYDEASVLIVKFIEKYRKS